MSQPTLAQLQAATDRLAAHLLQAHDIRSIGSASHMEGLHMAAHRRESTDWHDAWILERTDDGQAGR